MIPAVYVKSQNAERRKQGESGEVASRVGKQVYHTGQGQDERARTRPAPLLRGLDSAWSWSSNPHRESGTRWRAAADVGPAGRGAGTAHGRQRGRDGNRLGDSVGAHAPSTGEGPRSAQRSQTDTRGKRTLASGDVLARRMRKPRRFKDGGLIAGLVHPHAVDDAHPDSGQGSQCPRIAQRAIPSAEVAPEGRSMLLLFSGKGSEIPQPSGNGRAMRGALMSVHQ